MKKSFVFSAMSKLPGAFVLLFMIFVPEMINGQSSPGFQGTWVQDISKGDNLLPGFSHILTITLTDKTITIKETYIDDKSKEEDSEESTFSLDGKEVISKEPQWITRQWATMAPSKNELTIKTTQTTPDNLVVTSYEIYTLSGNGLILSKRAYNAENTEGGYRMVFKRK